MATGKYAAVFGELKNLIVGGRRVPYNNGVENFEGFSTFEKGGEAAQFYDEVFDSLVRVVNCCKNIRRAQSRGCYKKLAATIKSLTDVLDSLAPLKGDIKTIKKQYKKIIKKFKRLEENETMAGRGIINEAKACVNSVIKASAVLSRYYSDKPALVQNLNTSAEIANRILEALGGCVDDSSKEAAQLAGQIMKSVYCWRNHASIYACQSDDIAALESALEVSRRWQKMPVNSSRFKEARESDIVIYDPNGIPQKLVADFPELGEIEGKDEISTILTAEQAFEKLDSVKEAMDEFVYNGNYQRKQNLENKIGEKEALLQNYESEQGNVFREFENGNLSPKDANKQAAALEDKIEALKKELYGVTLTLEKGGVSEEKVTYGLKGDLAKINESIENRESFISKIRSKIEEIEGYSNDIYHFANLINGINFTDFIRILRGRGVTQDQIRTVMSELYEVILQKESELHNEDIAMKADQENERIMESVANGMRTDKATVTREVANQPKVKEVINGRDMFEEEGDFSALDRLKKKYDSEEPERKTNSNDDDLNKIGLGEDDR